LACLTFAVLHKIAQIRQVFIPIKPNQSHVHLFASPLRAPPGMLITHP
jgi:hypothetical protein